jgi:hypothetical protein
MGINGTWRPTGVWEYNSAMRRLLISAAFLLTIAIVPVCAQHGGGGHGGGGGHASAGGHAMGGGHSFGGGGFGGSHGGSYAASGSRYGSQARAGLGAGPLRSGSHYGSSGSAWGRGGQRRSGGTHWYFRTAPYGWGYGYPYYGDYYGYPWWGDDPGYDEQSDNQIGNSVDEYPSGDDDQDAYAQDPPYDPPSRFAASQRAPNEPNTVLVFRDGHEREIENYAIVATTLWNFAGAKTEKIPLDSLDIPATIRVNEQRGIDFELPHLTAVPDSGEGQ